MEIVIASDLTWVCTIGSSLSAQIVVVIIVVLGYYFK